MLKEITIASLVLLSGCANFTINATICDEIASDPHATMPEECRDYDEKAAEKAFNKVVDEKKVSDQDIKFDKEDEE